MLRDWAFLGDVMTPEGVVGVVEGFEVGVDSEEALLEDLEGFGRFEGNVGLGTGDCALSASMAASVAAISAAWEASLGIEEVDETGVSGEGFEAAAGGAGAFGVDEFESSSQLEPQGNLNFASWIHTVSAQSCCGREAEELSICGDSRSA